MVVNSSTLGFNYHIHPGGFFDTPMHWDRMQILVTVFDPYNVTYESLALCSQFWHHGKQLLTKSVISDLVNHYQQWCYDIKYWYCIAHMCCDKFPK